MPQEIGLWELKDKSLVKVSNNKIGSEELLEDLLEQDISIVSDELLIIGRQVETGFGKFIDLLCLKRNGDVAIVELKKDEAPRDTIAQALEYASWVDDLSYDEIEEMADAYFEKKGISLEDAFMEKFDEELPDTLNESHEILIVASDLDDQSERVIRYLSQYGIRINVIKLNYFKLDGHQLVGKVLLIPEAMKEIRGSRQSKRKKWDEESFFEDAKRTVSEEVFSAIHRLYEFSKEKADKIDWGTGPVHGSFSPKFQSISKKSIYTVSSDGELSIKFGWLDDNEYTLQWREKLRNKLKESPMRKYIPETCVKKYPKIPHGTWVPMLDDFISIMTKLLEESK